MEEIKNIIIEASNSITEEETKDALIDRISENIQKYIDENYVDITTYKRTAADFDNSRKRLESTYENRIANNRNAIFEEIVEFVDDFDNAYRNASSEEKDGITLLRNKFITYLSKNNIKLIYPIGEKFDENLHDAICTMPGENIGVIADYLKCGIIREDKVIRHAQVIVYN